MVKVYKISELSIIFENKYFLPHYQLNKLLFFEFGQANPGPKYFGGPVICVKKTLHLVK